MNMKKKVFVGVSGGVDSSVSAALLKDQGYDVVGVFIRTWTPEWIECTWRDERRDAMRVCAHLDIPFLECDAVEAYKKGVADYMISEYKAGRVPNPDVMCNREVKFGVFWEFAKSHSVDFIATGHYAQIIKHETQNMEHEDSNKDVSSFKLQVSRDSTKDQSYFLWTLTEEDLSHTLFPIGHLEKSEVRKLAERYRLPTATKKDSQGVCFIGEIDMKEFLKHYIETSPGAVLDESGAVIGNHDGAFLFALGERHGFTITKKGSDDPRYFVIAKDMEKNTITVSENSPNESKEAKTNYSLIRTNMRIIPDSHKTYKAQIRYHGEFFSCIVSSARQDLAELIFENPLLVSPGQSVVVYDGDLCIGGGIVQ
jgi:tRNA-specific 2-thiouridylase